MVKRNEIIGQWYFKNLVGHAGQLPAPKVGLFFMKSLLNIVGADGNISDREHKWVIGFATACGNPKEVIDELLAYQPSAAIEAFNDLSANIDPNFLKVTRRSMIYNAIRAAGADGDLDEKEIAAIYAFAKHLDVTEEQVRQVQDIYDEEKKLRENRIAILFPQGFEAALDEFDKHK